MTTTAKTIATARKYFAAARTMNRNVRLRRYEGRNGGGDSTFQMDAAEKLTREMPRALAGALWAEHRLALRISENRDAGMDRPELRARLAATRKEIRGMTPAA